MLRNVLLGFGCALLTFAVMAFVLNWPPPFYVPTFFIGLVVTVGTFFERKAYKPILDSVPAGQWRDTGERFIDPTSKRAVAVYADPASGKRIYVGHNGS